MTDAGPTVADLLAARARARRHHHHEGAGMSTPERHVEAVAAFMPTAHGIHARVAARALLASDSPAVHAAMLDALTRHGVLTEERRTLADGWASHTVSADGITKRSGRPGTRQRRLVTSWEVTP